LHLSEVAHERRYTQGSGTDRHRNLTATSATSDEQLIASWVANLRSEQSRINFRTTADRFLAALGAPMRRATVEDVRQALETITAKLAPSSSRQVVLRVKSLLSYGHRVGYLQFNAGAVIRVHGEARSVAQRIISEVEMGLLVRAAPSRRDRILIEVGYGGGLRVSELVALIWSDVIERDGGRVQLSVLGKGHKRREVLLPEVVSRSLLSLRGDAGANDPVFASPRGGHLTERAVNYMLKRAAIDAGINPKLSAHWLRHAHASHAIDRGAALPVVQSTLGHGNIAVTSGYLHARPGESSGLSLDPGVFLQRG
jgi:integrase/recombinase XerD